MSIFVDVSNLVKASMISWATRFGAVPGSIPESKLIYNYYTIVVELNMCSIDFNNPIHFFWFGCFQSEAEKGRGLRSPLPNPILAIPPVKACFRHLTPPQKKVPKLVIYPLYVFT